MKLDKHIHDKPFILENMAIPAEFFRRME